MLLTEKHVEKKWGSWCEIEHGLNQKQYQRRLILGASHSDAQITAWRYPASKHPAQVTAGRSFLDKSFSLRTLGCYVLRGFRVRLKDLFTPKCPPPPRPFQLISTRDAPKANVMETQLLPPCRGLLGSILSSGTGR